jgi:hypothetical protein
MNPNLLTRRRLLQIIALASGCAVTNVFLRKLIGNTNYGTFTASTFDSNYLKNASQGSSVYETKSTLFRYNLDEDNFVTIKNSVAGHCIEPLKSNKNLAFAVEKHGRYAALIDWSTEKELHRFSCENNDLFSGHCTFDLAEKVAFVTGYTDKKIGVISVCDLVSGKVIERMHLAKSGKLHDIKTLKSGHHLAIIGNSFPLFAKFDDAGNINYIQNSNEIHNIGYTHISDIGNRRLVAFGNKYSGTGHVEGLGQLLMYDDLKFTCNELPLKSYSWAHGEFISLELDANNRLWLTMPSLNKVSIVNLSNLSLEAEISIEGPCSLHMTQDKKCMVVGTVDRFNIYNCSDQKNSLDLVKKTQPMINHGTFSVHSRLI